jgi:uncharacterized ion transporter superfamily protein YfcC
MEKENVSNKPKKRGLSAFSLIYIILLVVAAVTWLIADVKNAGLSDIVMAPIKGFSDAVDICIFIIILGGFLGVIKKTGALDAGIASLVRKLK